MKKSINNPFDQEIATKDLPKKRDMIDAMNEAIERSKRQKRYIEDTITILDNRDNNQNVDELRALISEAGERLINYNNNTIN